MRPAVERERGQATVEFAMLLPLFVLAVLLVIQTALVGVDWLRVHSASREGARIGAAAVGDPVGSAQQAVGVSSTLSKERLTVGVQQRQRTITVTVRYRSPTNVPLVGALVPDVVLAAQTTMYIEESVR